MITQSIKVGIAGDLPTAQIEVTQGDHGIGQIESRFYNQSEQIPLTGYTVTFEGIQEGEKPFTVGCTTSGSVATLTVTEDMTRYPGEIYAAFKLSTTTGSLESDKVRLVVNRSARR